MDDTNRDATRAVVRRLLLLAALLGTGLAAGCTPAGDAPPSATSGSSAALSPAPVASASPAVTAGPSANGTASAGTGLVLPEGFPVMPGATTAPLPADPAVVARWTVPVVGSAPYDFYLSALPASGYPVVGRYPTERAALIRFEVSPGTVWQLLLEAADGGTLVTVQTDRP